MQAASERTSGAKPARRSANFLVPMRHQTLLVSALAVLCALAVWLALARAAPSSQDHARSAGLRYAQQQMVWTSGPRVEMGEALPLRHLQSALDRHVTLAVRQNVNVPDL